MAGSAGDVEGGVVRPNADAVSRRVGDDIVLVQLQTSQIFALNRTGARLWELLDEGHDLDHVQERLLLEFDVGQQQLRDEVRALVDELVERKLLDRDAGS